MSEKLHKVIQKQELFSKKDSLLVGVSGGMDSMVLCHLLLAEGFLFIIAHCNYHLRDLESNLDEELVKGWANENKITFYSKSCQIADHKNIQEEARKMRYDFFDEIKNQENCKFILTAHHANDRIETFFINLSRGAGIKGLKGIQTKSNDLIRPLICVSKDEIIEYARFHKVPYREDQSNLKSNYLRNFFRNEVLSVINTRIPTFDEMATRTIDQLSEVSMFLESVYGKWKNINYKEDSGRITIAKPLIENFYLLSNLLVELGFHPETINQVKKNYLNVGRKFTDKNNHELLVDREFIFIRKIKTDESLMFYLVNKDSGEFNLVQESLTWNSIILLEHSVNVEVPKNEALFDKNQLQFPLGFRKWLPGDSIKPFGMNGKRKKIQDVLTNNKVSLFDKETIYVLISNEEVLWIPGIMRSELAKIDENTNSYIHFKWKKRENLD